MDYHDAGDAVHVVEADWLTGSGFPLNALLRDLQQQPAEPFELPPSVLGLGFDATAGLNIPWAEEPVAEELVGRQVAKHFKGQGIFLGTITRVDKYVHVRYDDGDEEDYTREEAAVIMVAARPTANRKAGKRSAVHATAEVDGEYMKVPLEGGGFKRRRVGAKEWRYMCQHGERKTQCTQCGGASVCEHGRRRNRCKECGGSSVCEHGRLRYRCKECGGKGTCKHGRERSKCKECGGSSICEHGRQPYRYKECGGKGICEHGRRRSKCKECEGSSICEHGRQRYRCKECGGKGICEHGRQRQTCMECGGLSI